MLGLRVGSGTTVKASKWLEAWFAHAYRTAAFGPAVGEKTYQPTQAILYRHLLGPISAVHSHHCSADSEDPTLELMAELHNHCVARYETTGQTATRTMQALSNRRDMQRRLRTKLHALEVRLIFDSVSGFHDLGLASYQRRPKLPAYLCSMQLSSKLSVSVTVAPCLESPRILQYLLRRHLVISATIIKELNESLTVLAPM